MKNNILKTVRNYKFAMATFTALLLAGGASAQAQTSYTGTSSTGLWFSSRWNNTTDVSPYTSSFTANNAASFAAGNYTFSGGGTGGVGNVTLASGATVTFSGASGTWGTGGAVRTLNIGTGSLLDFGTQAMSTAAGTGFIKSGAGVLATTGGAYSGGFTLNAGTVIMRGVDAMGGSASNVLTLNGGTVASNSTRSLANTKYGGGIVIGGNVQFGELVTNVALASSTANLSFANNVSLGSGVRTFTLGNGGTQTFSGIISNTSGGISFSATAGGTGNFAITGAANTFTGPININAGEARFTADGSIGNAANDIIIDGGRFGKASDATTVTLGAGRDIFVGDGAGTSISSESTGTLIYNNAIANKTGEIGSWAKQGTGTLVLGGQSTYSGTTTVNAGTLAVNGSLLTGGSVVVNANGFLGGSGSVGAITGAGTVGPGNSPGILTATSVDPTAGTDFKFEFTALNPTYTSATASGNDLLHLTAASPFAGGTFTSGNIISIYLNSAAITSSLLAGTNTTFSGGFFVDGTFDLLAALSPASFAYYTTSATLGTGTAVDYNGVNFYALNSEIAAKTILSNTAVESAGFSTGTVAGTVLTFTAVPEPSAQSMLAIGMVALVAVRALRRGRGDS